MTLAVGMAHCNAGWILSWALNGASSWILILLFDELTQDVWNETTGFAGAKGFARHGSNSISYKSPIL